MDELLDELRRRAQDDPWLTVEAVVAGATAFADVLDRPNRLAARRRSRAEALWAEPADSEAWFPDEYPPDPYVPEYVDAAEILPRPYRDRTFPQQRGGSAEDLAHAAEQTTMTRRLDDLVAWVGDGRQVTDSQVLRPGAVGEVCSVLGLPPPKPDLYTALHHWPLNSLWVIARTTRRLEIRRSEAVSTGAPATEDRLAKWVEALSCVCHPDRRELRKVSGYRGQETAEAAVLLVLPELYVSGSVEAEAVVAEVLRTRATRIGEQVVPVLQRWLDLLVDLGAVVRAGRRYDVTPLGRYGLNRVLTQLGAEAPWADVTPLEPALVLEPAVDPAFGTQPG